MVSTNNEYRQLTNQEIIILKENRNISDNWGNISVKDGFLADQVKNSTFTGKVQIGIFTKNLLKYKTLALPEGIYNSFINSSSVGDNCAIHNATYISSYNIGNSVLLFNIDELSASPNAVYGNGFIKEDGSRNWMNIVNENKSRGVLPFYSMETGDCHLWARLRGDIRLLSKFILFTDTFNRSDEVIKRASIGNFSTLRSCRIIKDTIIGEYSHIFCVSHLENITVNSSKKIPTTIGEDSDLRNGIIGYGAEVRHGARASDFILANNSTLKYGAIFLNSYLGENSTVSCCEVNSTMLLPYHEQHHNNSFLIASLLNGQSNIGAGSTIGSNHNSRSADGEISAGRGFWTAVGSSIKHNCSFASFTILAKNDFLHEMKIPTPFSLVSLDQHTNCLQIMPAYWFMYNMYALTRNAEKFKIRDMRADKNIIIETDYLAPDTVEEIFNAIEFLEKWTALLCSEDRDPDIMEIDPGVLENSKSRVRILKPVKAFKAYKEMLIFYSVKVLCNYAEKNNLNFEDIKKKFQNSQRSKWINLGGQLIQENDFNKLIRDIKQNNISTWDEVHLRYREISSSYPEKKTNHAYAVLQDLYPNKSINNKIWNNSLREAVEINKKINIAIRQSREKDHTNPFRHITFSSAKEAEAVLGKLENNEFLIKSLKDSSNLEELISKYIND